MHDVVQARALSTGITVLVVIAVVALRNRRPRPLRVELLWLRPLMVCAVLAATLLAAPTFLTLPALALIGAAFVIGAALGWQRGRMMRIEADPATHELTVRASPLGVAFILAFVVLRVALSALPAGHLLPASGFPTLALPSALLALGAGMLSLQALEMWLRARGLLAAARADG